MPGVLISLVENIMQSSQLAYKHKAAWGGEGSVMTGHAGCNDRTG